MTDNTPWNARDVLYTTARATADVGSIFGVNGEEYDLTEGDTVTLPRPNAEVLGDGEHDVVLVVNDNTVQTLWLDTDGEGGERA